MASSTFLENFVGSGHGCGRQGLSLCTDARTEATAGDVESSVDGTGIAGDKDRDDVLICSSDEQVVEGTFTDVCRS